MLVLRWTALMLVAALGPVTLAASASAAGYHSPGYDGTKSFRDVKQAPLPAIPLGIGKDPSLLVDAAGTAHVVFAKDGGASAPDTVSFCNLQRGIKKCASAGAAPNPQAPDSSQGGVFAGNFPAGNHDIDGPVPLDIGNELFVIDRRFPDVFNTPGGGTADSNVFEWNSADGGATLTGPGQLGDNQMAGGAVAYGDPDAAAIGTLSRTETGGTFFQGTAGHYTTEKAQLGTGDQAYDGSLALDGTTPIAAFADLSGNVLVREWSGHGDINDAATWSQSSFSGFSPRIVGGAAGVFVLYSDSSINAGKLRLQRIVNGRPSGAAVALGTSTSEPAISEDPSGAISFAYTDQAGVQVRTSTHGIDFSPPQLTALIPKNGTIGHLVTAATADGGGFVSFISNPVGAEGVGQVVMSAFGDQHATGKPGLGPLPGGGIGSAVGDQLATSTCESVKFGDVDAEIMGPCFSHAASNPNLDVTLGELNLNGLRIVPDPGVRIGIDPKLHTIDTTGKVRVELVAPGIDPITLWHDELHVKLPTADAGTDLFDLHELAAPIIEGFPIDGDVDIKLVKGGVDIPISLKLPGSFGGVTGSATLHVSAGAGLDLSSLRFQVGDVNLAALELKGVDVSYTMQGDVWKGSGQLLVPAGGGALSATVAVEFDNGDFTKGSVDLGLAYPGVPLDDSDPPPQLYLSHAGLGLGLNPLTLSGSVGLGITPLKPPGEGDPLTDYAFHLEGQLSAAFGSPVTVTVSAQGFLYTVKLAQATLVYKVPDQATVTGTAAFDLGLIKFDGQLGAIVNPKDKSNPFGGQIKSTVTIRLPAPAPDLTLPSVAFAFNKSGFGVYIPPPGFFGFFGTVTYQWGDAVPKPFWGQDVTGRFAAGVPKPASARAADAAGATSFSVPAHAPSASLIVHGSTGPPTVTLIAPNGQQITPPPTGGPGVTAVAIPDPTADATYVGLHDPSPGRWTVVQASGSQFPISSLESSLGEPPPKVRASVTGTGFRRTVHYHATIPANVTIRLVERGANVMHVIGSASKANGTIHFRPAFGPAGRRSLVAEISNNGVPLQTDTLASFVVPRPLRPGRARGLHVVARHRAFRYSFTSPANAAHVLVRVVATDGRHLERVVAPTKRTGSVPAIGFRDGVTITVIGLGADGSRGPAVTAKARTISR